MPFSLETDQLWDVIITAAFIMFGWMVRDDDDAKVLIPALALFGAGIVLQSPWILGLGTIFLSLAILVGFAEWIRRYTENGKKG